MAPRLNNYFWFCLFLINLKGFSQSNDSLHKPFNEVIKIKNLSLEVAKAQINLLKKDGALLVRLKTNANTIKKLKEAGNVDLATQIETETFLSNQIIVDAFMKEFTFCPVYFFYSDYSDSVKHKKLHGIFIDTNMVTNPSVVCNQSFVLVAEFGGFYNSSLNILKEEEARHATEGGNYIKDVQVVLKSRYFFQLHKPFPYVQFKPYSSERFQKNAKGILKDETIAYQRLKKMSYNSMESTKMKNYRGYVNAFNSKLMEFYTQYKDYVPSKEVMEFVY